MSTPRLLIIDDDESVHGSLRASLDDSFIVHSALSGEEGLAECQRARPDIVLLDLMLPQMGGMAVLRALKESIPDLPVIVMTAYAEVHTAVLAIKLGAVDYVQKPLDPAAVERQAAQIVAQRSPRVATVDTSIVGTSPALKRAWRLVERFGPTDIPILIQGETGTGKGLIAEAIHRVSKRAHAPFVAIDCATIPGELAESELFGYEDGAFTGAGKKKRGRVAFADRGTLFFDEIGTLALGTQAKLLTLIEQQAFVPLGARTSQPTVLDARFISATNLPLHQAAEQGTFRADLFHRLNGVVIELPPLRERDGDIALLARHFANHSGHTQGKHSLDISPEALAVLCRYHWPGNVRELQRVMSVASVLAHTTITVDDLPDRLRAQDPIPDPVMVQDDGPLRQEPSMFPVGWQGRLNLREIKEWAGREAQKRVIMELQTRGNISRQDLARMLGVDPKTLRSRLKEMSDAKIVGV